MKMQEYIKMAIAAIIPPKISFIRNETGERSALIWVSLVDNSVVETCLFLFRFFLFFPIALKTKQF